MIPHSERSHATLAPSAAHRWIACPASVKLSVGIEDTSSVFAQEGTAAHELASACLENGKDAAHYKGASVDTASGRICSSRPDEKTVFLVNADMVDAVQVYLDVAREVAEESEEFEIEQRMDMSGFTPGVFGTGDFIAYRSAPTRRVTICDYKHGRGVAVDVEQNEQLLTYALGVANRFHNRGVDEVELIVVQPRAPHPKGPVRRWSTDVLTLVEHAMAMQVAEEKIAAGTAEFKTGEHCRFCRGAAICPALHSEVERIVGSEGDIVMGVDDPAKYDPQTLANKLTEAPLVNIWLKRLEEFAHAEAVRGRVPPGFKLVAKRATRQWKDAGVAAETLQMLGVPDDDLFDTKMCSPAQVEKALPKSQRSIIGDLAAAVSSGTALASLDDPRPGVDALNASGFEATEIEER